MFKSLKNNNAGFSIVEIMIVLVVIGLVTVGIILAGSTLQRNSRNSARDSDVRLIAQQIQDFAIDNAGKLPSSISVVEGVSGKTDNTLNLAYYNSDNEEVILASPAVKTLATNSYLIKRTSGAAGHDNNIFGNGTTATSKDVAPDVDNFHIWVGYKCPDNDAIATNNSGTWEYDSATDANFGTDISTRSFIIIYRVEGSGGEPYRCVGYSTVSQ